MKLDIGCSIVESRGTKAIHVITNICRTYLLILKLQNQEDWVLKRGRFSKIFLTVLP